MIRKRRYISGIPFKEKERRRSTVTTSKKILRESLKKGCPLFFFCNNGTAFFNTKDGNIIKIKKKNYDNNRIYKFNNCIEGDYK